MQCDDHDNKESALLITGLPSTVSRLTIILSLSVESGCNIRSTLGLLLVNCCQSLFVFQWDVKLLNVYKFGL